MVKREYEINAVELNGAANFNLIIKSTKNPLNAGFCLAKICF